MDLSLGLLVTLLATPAAASSPILRLESDPENARYGTVEAGPLAPDLVDGLAGRAVAPEVWRSILAVYTGREMPSDGRPAIIGSWAVENGLLRFRPRYPLVAGLDYVARFDPGALRSLTAGASPGGASGGPVTASFSLPKPELVSTTSVTAVYPTTSELPENQLRFYVHFSAPMSRGEAYRHLRLLDATGAAIEAPFLEISEELWGPGMRRLTLFFDPGRIKRGLRPHLEAGPPLRAGAAYRLEIDAAWRDARGVPLAAGFSKDFAVTAPDRRAPDPADWQVVTPSAGSRDPLELRFPEPLDHGLLERVLRVRAGGEVLSGEVEIVDQEKLWRWTPEAPWSAGDHVLEVETLLEDLAGNNLAKVFDVDLSDRPAGGEQTAPDRRTITIPLTVRAP